MSDVRRSTQHRRSGLAVLLLGLAVAGCATTPATPDVSASTRPVPSLPFYSAEPTGTPEPRATVYARIEQQVQDIRGLTATVPVVPDVIDPAALATILRARFDKDNPAAFLAASQRLDRAFGLIPADGSLKDLELQLLEDQVVGFYQPDTKRLVVVSGTGALGAGEQIAFAHEFDHALQDQHFDLTKLDTAVADQGDRSLARLSLAEGDATILMSDWAQSALTPLQLLQYLQQSNLSGQSARLAKLPAFLKAELLFPYTSGVAFVQGLVNKGGWAAVDQVYSTPPDSTEQILHPEKYVAHEAPVKVSVPGDLAARLGSGWSVDLQDTFGEFGLRTWLQSVGGLDVDAATAAAAGWGGDRTVLVTHGDRFAIALQTVWDTPADAVEFAAAAQTTRAKLSASTALIDPGTSNRVTVFVGSDTAAITQLAAALGLAG